ncbi:MAG: guanylate kinase [Pseudomonadota bacterium]|nr:guanylate kinase [Pseudomonadota bacterium]
MQQRVLFVLAAPSGTGKTTIAEHILRQDHELMRSVSYTTRARRVSEVAQDSYHFIDEAGFLEMVENNAFVEFAKIYGHFYGTPRQGIDNAFAAGKDVLLVVDWQGAHQIQKTFTDCVTIFLLPPSYSELMARLQNRGEDTPEVIKQRLSSALQEFEHYPEFDYLIINDRLEQSIAEVSAIIVAERLKTARQTARCKDLVHDLQKQMKV